MKIFPSDSAEGMAALQETPSAKQVHCRLCGLVYNGQAGRLQGSSFVCTPCGNVDKSIRRNLGDRDGLPPWSCEDQQHFFRQMQAEKQGKNLPWKTIKAAFVTSLTTSVVNSFTAMVEAEELPLSVWLQRGWEESLVKLLNARQSIAFCRNPERAASALAAPSERAASARLDSTSALRARVWMHTSALRARDRDYKRFEVRLLYLKKGSKQTTFVFTSTV